MSRDGIIRASPSSKYLVPNYVSSLIVLHQGPLAREPHYIPCTKQERSQSVIGRYESIRVCDSRNWGQSFDPNFDAQFSIILALDLN